MKTRLLIRLLTLTSWLPIAACASSDEGDIQPGSVGGGGTPAPRSEDENLNASIDGSLNVNNANVGLDDDLNVNNNASGNKNNANLEADNEGGDSNFDDMENEGNGAAVAAAGPATDAGNNINGFENNAVGTENAFKNNAPLEANTATAGTNEAIDAFKNTAIETDAFAGSQNNATENLAGVNTAPVQAPAPVVEAPPAPVPVPTPAPAVVQTAVVSTPAPQPVPHDVESTNSILHWVGYKINENLKKLDVEIVTKGRPEYEIFEQSNRMQQSELIIRFYHTTLRQKLRWDVNSSEFRSPVAYIRMKNKADQGYVDLVITHRDKIEPLFYEKNGNFLLSYAIPERYFGSQAEQKKKLKDKAISLSGDKPLAKASVSASKLPAVGFPRYFAQFKEAPKLRPIREYISVKKAIRNTKDGLPESFSREIIGKRTGEILSRKTLLGVAQDDLENDFEDEASNNAVNNAANNNASNNSNNNLSNTNNAANNAQVANPAGAEGTNNVGGNNFSNGAEPNAFSDLDNKAENIKEEPKANAAQGNSSMENLAAPLDTSPIPAPTDAPMMATEPQDVEPTDASGPKQQYTGKPIFMEFFDAPLSLVLKGFSEETGNNFVFPADVGSTMVTVNFKAVPWDEALKAILETYSLGMVRIGENVVRVDKIAALTGYMQALEAAKQYETRRVPTKVMISRLNNGVAKDIKDKVEKLLARDIEIDSRIKISEDERTNSLVIEAPAVTLAKANAIIARLDLETPQVEIASRIVEVRKENSDLMGIGWGNNLNFDPGRALGFGTLNFPNSFTSNYSVDPGVTAASSVGQGRFRFGSLNKFLDLDLLLKLEEKKSTINVLQSNRVLVLDGQKASILAGSSQFFRPAGGGNVINPAAGAGQQSNGLAEVTFDLRLEVVPQVTALGNVIMNLLITSDTPGSALGEALASKSTRRLETQMVRASGDTGVIGGIYDTKRTSTVSGIPWLSDLPIVGALFRSTSTSDIQTELLIMVTPTILSGPEGKNGATADKKPEQSSILSSKNVENKGRL